jgi:hypothetical protein
MIGILDAERNGASVAAETRRSKRATGSSDGAWTVASVWPPVVGVLLASAVTVVLAADAVLAAPSPLRLSAVVYAKHVAKNGTVSSHEHVSQNGIRVGEDYSTCTPQAHEAFRCTGEYKLTHGRIKFAGTVKGTAKTQTLTITSGTGNYQNAHGHIRTEYNNSGSRATETITFTS